MAFVVFQKQCFLSPHSVASLKGQKYNLILNETVSVHVIVFIHNIYKSYWNVDNCEKHSCLSLSVHILTSIEFEYQISDFLSFSSNLMSGEPKFQIKWEIEVYNRILQKTFNVM